MNIYRMSRVCRCSQKRERKKGGKETQFRKVLYRLWKSFVGSWLLLPVLYISLFIIKSVFVDGGVCLPENRSEKKERKNELFILSKIECVCINVYGKQVNLNMPFIVSCSIACSTPAERTVIIFLPWKAPDEWQNVQIFCHVLGFSQKWVHVNRKNV